MIMSKWSLLLLTLALLLVAGSVGCGGAPATFSQPPSELTIVSVVTGEVLVMKAGATTWRKASPGMTLEPGDRIRTGSGSNAVITFFEGSTIELAANTEISVSELGIAERTGSTSIRLQQQVGKTRSRVKKLVDPASRYEIETPDGAAVARGSIGDTIVEEKNSTTFINIEGRWSIIFDGREIPLLPGYQITFVKGQLTVPVPVQVPPPPIPPPPPPLPPPSRSIAPPPLLLRLSEWQTWTQTTVSDFNSGIRRRVAVIDVGGGDGTAILAPDPTAEVSVFPDQTHLSYTPGLYHDVYGTMYQAQTFRAGVTADVVRIALRLARIGNPAPLLVELRNCMGGGMLAVPGNIVYARVTDNINAAGEYQFFLSRPFTVFAGRCYSIVLHQEGNGGSSSAYYAWYSDNTTYGGGMAWRSSDGGSSWQQWAQGREDFYFATFVRGHYPSGTLESSSYDCGGGAEFGTISWDERSPSGTELKFQIATNNDNATWNFVGPDGTPATFYETSDTDIWSGHDSHRYIKYRAYFRTLNPVQTPELREVRITFR